MPTWLKIFLGLSLGGLVLSALGNDAPAIAIPIVFVALIVWPGPDKANPRLVRAAPYFWTLGVASGILVLGFDLLGKNIWPPEIQKPSTAQLLATVLPYPILMWCLIKRHRRFKVIIALTASLYLIILTKDFLSGLQDWHSTIQFVGDALTETIMTIYLILKVSEVPRASQTTQSLERN